MGAQRVLHLQVHFHSKSILLHYYKQWQACCDPCYTGSSADKLIRALLFVSVSASVQPALRPKLIFIVFPLLFFPFFEETLQFITRHWASISMCRTGVRIWSSGQAICPPGPQWDLINTATADREMWLLWSPTLTGIMDQLLGHSGLIVPAAWPLRFLPPHLFVSTLLIKELGNRIP